MSKGSHGVHRDLASALKQQAQRSGEQAPSVRGSDWRLATVTTVGTDGTVTADGIVCRRMAAYQAPAVGDLISISQSSNGNWRAEGRMVPTAGDGWQAPTMTSPWIAYPGGGNYQAPRCRKLSNGLVVLEGLVASNSVSVTGTSNVLTLPAGYAPSAWLPFPMITTGNAVRQLEVTETGVVRFVNLPAGAVGFVSINCTFMAATT